MATSCPSVEPKAAPMIGPSRPTEPPLPLKRRAAAKVQTNFIDIAPSPRPFWQGCSIPLKDWSLTTLKEKLIKIGAKVISHGRYVAFQMTEVAIPMFANILRLIAELRPPLVISTA
jgi:hypothetical protein